MIALAYTVRYVPKKKLIESEVFLFVGIAILYVCLTGFIVSKSVTKEKLKTNLIAELHLAQETESAFVAEGGTLSAFTQHGYEEPQLLEVIKRKQNVAENNGASFY